jgi:hypothetical protein
MMIDVLDRTNEYVPTSNKLNCRVFDENSGGIRYVSLFEIDFGRLSSQRRSNVGVPRAIDEKGICTIQNQQCFLMDLATSTKQRRAQIISSVVVILNSWGISSFIEGAACR